MKTCFKEVYAKSILNPSRIPEVCYAINPYIGCQHGCTYCYARFMKKYSGHQNDEWGSFVDIKINAVEVLENQLWRKRKANHETVLLSSVTDAYQPIEREYKITKQCIELLDDYGFPISILTKSDLVVRDTEILGHNSKNDVGFTIISLEEKVRRAFEPSAPNSTRRLTAMRTLSDVGIRTWGFVGPILPYLSTNTMPELIRQLAESGAEYILFDRLNLRPMVKKEVLKTLTLHFPDIQSDLMDVLSIQSDYYEKARKDILEITKSHGIEAKIVF